MRAMRSAPAAMVLASLLLMSAATEAFAFVPTAIETLPAVAASDGGAVDGVHWVRRCYWVRRCAYRSYHWRWVGVPTPNDGCWPWSATHWGLRRAFVC
jgi:hypothetical protein